jgi:adenylate kinase family enzyme
MRRVSVVGASGSGKSTLARELGTRLGVPTIELDAIHHLSDWEPIGRDEFLRRVTAIAATDEWVIDGNYGIVVRDGPVWQRADTVVWLDLPKKVVMRQVIGRTLRRVARREVLWNGNRERWSNVFHRDPDRSIIRWAWTTHRSVAERYRALMNDERFPHLVFVRLQSRAEIGAWLDRAGPRTDRRP